jgi:glycosyltransferase involved in cell wall biosynthesis
VHPVRVAARAYRAERRALRELIDRLSPAVVHTHGYRADLQAGGLVRHLGIPVCATVHGFTGGDWKNRLYESFDRWALRRFDAVVAVSTPLRKRLGDAGVPGPRLHLIRNACAGGQPLLSREEARRILGLPNGALVAGFVGRLSAEKGPDLWLEALGRLAAPGVLGCVIGDGPERPRLEARAAALGLGTAIRFAGAQPEAGRLFSAFDVFVLSSRTEGTPVVLFEAMAAGVPIVAAAVGGVPDVVGSEEAWLTPPGDVEAIAGALRAAQAEPAEARRRAEAARGRLAREFAVDPWLDRYEEIYRQLAAAQKPRA